jgi:hypothetical protein
MGGKYKRRCYRSRARRKTQDAIVTSVKQFESLFKQRPGYIRVNPDFSIYRADRKWEPNCVFEHPG